MTWPALKATFEDYLIELSKSLFLVRISLKRCGQDKKSRRFHWTQVFWRLLYVFFFLRKHLFRSQRLASRRNLPRSTLQAGVLWTSAGLKPKCRKAYRRTGRKRRIVGLKIPLIRGDSRVDEHLIFLKKLPRLGWVGALKNHFPTAHLKAFFMLQRAGSCLGVSTDAQKPWLTKFFGFLPFWSCFGLKPLVQQFLLNTTKHQD